MFIISHFLIYNPCLILNILYKLSPVASTLGCLESTKGALEFVLSIWSNHSVLGQVFLIVKLEFPITVFFWVFFFLTFYVQYFQYLLFSPVCRHRCLIKLTFKKNESHIKYNHKKQSTFTSLFFMYFHMFDCLRNDVSAFNVFY